MYQSTAATLIYFRWNLVLHKAAYLVPSDLSFTDIKFITIIKYILVERVRVAELLSNSVGVDLQCTLLICSHAFEILRLYIMCTEKHQMIHIYCCTAIILDLKQCQVSQTIKSKWTYGGI